MKEEELAWRTDASKCQRRNYRHVDITPLRSSTKYVQEQCKLELRAIKQEPSEIQEEETAA